MPHTPSYFLRILYCAFSNIYDDLREAEKFLRSKESLVSATFIKPGGLTHDEQKGHALSMEFASVDVPLSYWDLAAGMVEVADDYGGRYDMQSVSVNPVAKDVAFPWESPLRALRGLLFHFLPWTYRFLG